MRNKIKLVRLNCLKSHEETLIDKVAKIKNDLILRRCLKNPVIVDRDNFIILDGHHRVTALKQLGANKIPAFLVDYQNKNIRVSLRRHEFKFLNIKQAIIDYCLKGKIFPSKTTRHLIKNRPRNINYKLSKLY